MKKLLLIALPILLFSCNAPKIYETEYISKANSHSNVAILPFTAEVELRPKQMENLSEKELKDIEYKEGESVQQALYTWFLNQKSKDRISVKVQDENKTNRILAENNISQENITEFSSEEIGQILDVDGLIRGHITTNQPMSEGASIALGLLVGFWGSTNKGDIDLNLYDVGSNELLWRYDHQLSGSIGSDNQSIINAMMRKASKKLPYRIDK